MSLSIPTARTVLSPLPTAQRRCVTNSAFLKWLFAAGVVLLLKNRNISAFGDVDADGIVLSGHQVISFEGASKLVGLNAHDGIGGLVEVFAPAEDLGGDGIAFYFVGSPGQRGFHNERQKGFLDVSGFELGAGRNAVELLPDRFSIRDGFWIGCSRL